MPTYDYKCEKCEKVFEHFQSISSEPLTTCLCEEKGSVKKLISGGTGIIFKGSGFYVTDYKKSDSGKTSSTEKSSDSSSNTSTSSGTTNTTPTPSQN
ncbi:MAG: FmdB family zinc ribbon protein [Leptospiraceae bacterium]|nr:FmdB family zinc ribbon protein [Leptospiraceae bacterium]